MGKRTEPSERPRVAALYVRVSKDIQEQDGTSLISQEEHCRAYAATQGYAVDETYIYREVHTGAELHERPKLSVLRRAVRAGVVGAIVAYAVDRLSRKQAHTAILAEECERAGVALLFVTEEFERSAVGEFIRSAKAFAAEIEREKIKERTQRGLESRMRGGKPMGGGRPLYGYRWRDAEKSGYEIEEATAPIVQRIFAAAAAGQSMRAISIALTCDGVPTPTGKVPTWKHTTIQNILAHPGYTGEAVALRYATTKFPGGRGHCVRPEAEQIPLPPGTIPSLISRDLFDAVQAQLIRNKEQAPRNGRSPESFLLRGGLIRCGYCGKAVSSRMALRTGKQAKLRGRRGAYFIGPNDTHRDCRTLSIDSATLDAVVWSHVEAILTRPEIIAVEVERLRASDPVEGEIAAVDRALTSMGRKSMNLARALAMFDDAETAAPVVAEIDALARQRRQLEQERAGLLARRAGWEAARDQLAGLEQWCRQVAANLGELSYAEKRLTLNALNLRVRLYQTDHNPRYEITASVPIEEATVSANCVHNLQEFLRNEGVAFERRDYFKHHFTAEELRTLLTSLNLRPADVLSRRSRAYSEMIGNRDLSDDKLFALMAQEPTLLRRPLVVRGDRAVIGFDRAAVAALTANQGE